MKTILLSIMASIMIIGSVEAGRVKANFSSYRGEKFILVLNGQRMNGRPTNNLMVNHLRPGRNHVKIKFFRNGYVNTSNQTIFLRNGFETFFTISGGRHGHINLVKNGQQPIIAPRPEVINDRFCGDTYHYPASKASFDHFFRTLRNQRFDDDKYLVATEFLRGRRINTYQLGVIIDQFSFENSRIDFVVLAYSKLVDPQNFYTLYDHFRFRSSIREVNNRLGKRTPY